MNWQKSKVFITHCSIYYSKYQEARKTKKLRIHMLDVCCLSSTSNFIDSSKDEEPLFSIFVEYI